MNRKEENSDSIPIDLINEILSRLPAKSVARFRCVSKLWGSTLGGPYFPKLFLTMSKARPRILFVLKTEAGEWSLFSSPQPQNPYQKSSLVVAADFHINLSRNNMWMLFMENPYGYASGLIYFPKILILKERLYKPVIFNPSTGQYAILPAVNNIISLFDFLGFDPIGKQYKVLSMDYYRLNNQILTLGTGTMRWRDIQCPLTHHPLSESICINGVLYYLASDMIVCFDVRSEKFEFIRLAHSFKAHSFNNYPFKLVNYKGKLGVISCKGDDASNVIKLCMGILEDAEKHKLSEYVYTLPESELFHHRNVSVAGVTTTGEIVLSMVYACKPFYVFYFNPERNTLQSVEIQGFGELDKFSRVYISLDHVEDLNNNIMNATSIHPLEQKLKPMSTSSTSSQEEHDQKQERPCRVYISLDHVEDLNYNIMNATTIHPPEQKRKPMSTSSTSSQEEHDQKQERPTFESNSKAPICMSPPPEQKRRPTSTSTPSKKAHHQQQGHRTFESINKFDALCLLADDDVGESEYDSSFTDHVEDLMKTIFVSPPEKKRRKPKRTSKEDHRHKEQDRRRLERINKKSKCDFSLTSSMRVLPLCWITILLILVIMFMF